MRACAGVCVCCCVLVCVLLCAGVCCCVSVWLVGCCGLVVIIGCCWSNSLSTQVELSVRDAKLDAQILLVRRVAAIFRCLVVNVRSTKTGSTKSESS